MNPHNPAAHLLGGQILQLGSGAMKYRVVIEETATYEREVVARSKAEAIRKAEKHFLSAQAPRQDHWRACKIPTEAT